MSLVQILLDRLISEYIPKVEILIRNDKIGLHPLEIIIHSNPKFRHHLDLRSQRPHFQNETYIISDIGVYIDAECTFHFDSTCKLYLSQGLRDAIINTIEKYITEHKLY